MDSILQPPACYFHIQGGPTATKTAKSRQGHSKPYLAKAAGCAIGPLQNRYDWLSHKHKRNAFPITFAAFRSEAYVFASALESQAEMF